MTAAPSPTLADDREARHRAQTEHARPLLLEAGAGTGKTTTLVARILAWCLGPGWERHHRRAEREAAAKGGRPAPPPPDGVAADVLEKVVAITFTEDAAAEMAQRVARELAALADPGRPVPDWLHLPEPDPAERSRRAGALLATLDRLVVRTIHAFCRGLLADHPLEARLHPDLTVDAEGLLLEEVARETVEANLRTFYGGDADLDNPYLRLAVRGVGPRELVEALVALSQAGVPEDGLDRDPLAPERVAGLRRRLRDACRKVDGLVGPVRGRLGRARAALDLAEAVASFAGLPPDGKLEALVADLQERFPPNRAKRLKDWSKADGELQSKTETAAFEDVREPLAAAAGDLRALLDNLAKLDPELLHLAHAALAPLHRQVRRELRARGIATFEDLLAEAARLLSERPDVAAGARARIEQLLVDEFQDTDALQCEIVARLGLEGPPGHRPGLFLVGDPKQSIYGWRSADLASYDAFKERLLAAGGACLPLVRNFRSVPPVLDEVQRLVAPVMLPEEGLQPPYQPLLPDPRLEDDPGFTTGPSHPSPTRPGEPRPALRRAAVEHWVSWQAGGDSAAASSPALATDPERCLADTPRAASYELEADAVARDLRDLHDRHGVPWQEAAVLLRSTSDLDVYLEALRRHGVPFAVGRDKQYYRRREVIDAAALVRCVLDPGDQLALLTVLRSPWVGVPDAALVPLWNRGFPDRATRLGAPGGGATAGDGQRLRELRDLAQEAAGDLAALEPGAVPGLDRVAGWELSLAAALEQLAVARRAFRERPADAFVDVLRHLFLPEPLAAARYLGAYRLANLERFFRRLVTALEDGGGDVTAVLRALRRSVTEAREAPEGKPREGADEAVQVLTMHQAKGLDFGHVYLPQLHKEPGGTPPETVVERAPAEGGGADAAGPGGGGFEMKLFGAPTLGFDRVEARSRRVEAAERVRLLYVATTRPKRRLVLLGCWPADPLTGRREPERAASFVDLLAHRRTLPEPSLEARWQELAVETEDRGAARAADGPAGGAAATGTGGGRGGDGAGGARAPADREPSGGGTFTDGEGVLWRFPALTRWPEAPVEPSAATPEAPDPRRVAAAARELEQRRQHARTRMDRPFHAAASEESHHLLRQDAAGPEGDGGPPAEAPSPGTAPSPESAPSPEDAMDLAVALAVGTAVHRLLEEIDPAADPAAELDRLRHRLPEILRSALPEAERPAARTEVEAILDRLAGGRLLARLARLAPHLLGREVSLLLAPPTVTPAEAEAAQQAPGTGPPPPVAFLSGSIDLLYRDPDDGALVVADYKTDRVDDDGIERKKLVYGRQGRVYVQAVRRALGLDGPGRDGGGGAAGEAPTVRFELWFLRADRIVPVDVDAEALPGPPRRETPPVAEQISLFDLEE